MASELRARVEAIEALYADQELIPALDALPPVLDAAREEGARGGVARLLLVRAKCLQQLGDLDGAQAAVHEALQDCPRSRRAEALRLLGLFHRLRGDREGARRLLRESLGGVRRGDVAERALVVRLLADVSPPSEARPLLEQLLSLALTDHDRGSTLYRLAALQLDGGDEEQGFARLLQAGRLLDDEHPVYQGYRCDLGLHLLRRGELDRARDCFAAVEGRGLVATARALGLAAVAVARGDEAAFEDQDRTRRHAMLDRRQNDEVAQIAELAAGFASDRGDLDRAVRCEQAAWHLHSRGSRQACTARLASLRARGGPVVLGSFLVRERIGHGGMSTVWRATPVDGGDHVAIKVVTPEHADAGELDAVGALDHPAIVPLLDHGRADGAAAAAEQGMTAGGVWLAMPLYRDGTLAPRCAEAPWEQVRTWLHRVLDALGHAHARGLLHLDIKPANVLVDGDGARLADFGIARWLGAHRGRAMGSPTSMAPEQWRRRGTGLGPWTDLYGVGCLAVELVQGSPVWTGPTAHLRQHHLRGEVPPLEPRIAVPEGLEDWVRRCLAKLAEDRFQRAGEAARALDALGPPTRQPVEHAAGPAPWTTTFELDELPTEEIPPLPAAETLAPRPGPVCPGSVPAVSPAAAAGPAALSLFGLRPPRWVGREDERRALWSALRRVMGTGRGEAVVLVAPPGRGARRLATWLGAVAHHHAELPVRGPEAMGQPGPAVVVAPHLPDDHPGWAALSGPLADGVLAVVSASRDPGVGTVLPLPPLHDDEVARLCRHLLPLAPGRVRAMVEAASGSPGWVVQTLHDQVARDRLRPTPAGLDLRPGTPWDPAPSLRALLKRRATWLREVLSDEERAWLGQRPEELQPERLSWLLRRGILERTASGWRRRVCLDA